MNLAIKITCLFLLGSILAQAQSNCGFNYAYEQLFIQDSLAKAKFDNINRQFFSSGKNIEKSTSAASSFTIPIVFHVLHLGGSENISDAQIQDAVGILNRDFRKQNADTTNIVTAFKPIAADCNIKFVLASLDENGKCTNGITRHYTTKANWTIDFTNYIYTWDPTKYLNIYVVNSMPSGIAGYAYLPGSVGPTADAIVILHNYVGSMGTSNPYVSRAFTHEVGHWLNLAHTWGNTNSPGVACGDDGVGDTPDTKGHNNCNLGSPIDCTPGVIENIQNYMEYSYCCNMFTQGQRARMHTCLNGISAGRNNLSTFSNLLATGVIVPFYNCAPKAEYLTNSNITCSGSSLVFVDQSYNGNVSNWLWSSPSANASSTLQNGVLSFTNPGLTTVKLKVSNVFGSDSISKQLVTVLSAGTNSGNIATNQGFEVGTFPDNNWIASTIQYGSPFTQTSSAAASGSNCVWVNNYYDNPNGAVAFYSPAFNLQNSVAAQLSFKYAYAQQNNANNDAFDVYYTTNCGATWSPLYSSAGAALSTAGALFPGPFLNPPSNQWRTENLNILSLSGNTQVYFMFVFTPDVNGPGNNFFIDDINLNTVVGMKENTNAFANVKVFPNPFSDELIIENNTNEIITSLKVFDISLRELMELNANELANKKIVLKDVQKLNKGIYFIELKSDNAQKMLKLIKE